jgi:hypothetical protein
LKILLLIHLAIFLSKVSDGQSIRQPISAIYLGLGAYSMHQGDVFSFVNNQAALAQIKNVSAGVYGERRFMMAATSMYSAAVAIPTNRGNFGMNLVYAGFKNFNEYQIGLAYARSVGSLVDIGMQFNYYGYRIPAYVNTSTLTVEMGAMFHLTDQLNAGFHIYNPIGAKMLKSNEQLAAVYKMGLGYDVSKLFLIAAEMVKEENSLVNLNVGVQYQMVKQFFIRVGVSTATASSYGGVGIYWNNMRLDISGSYHPQLGWSPGLLLLFNSEKTILSPSFVPK